MEHCWHKTGVSTTYLGGGTKQVKCCNCGKTDHIHYKIESKPIPGHGKYVNVNYINEQKPGGSCEQSLDLT